MPVATIERLAQKIPGLQLINVVWLDGDHLALDSHAANAHRNAYR